jgi:outer membrane translocation and assembly module TamA
VHASASAPFDLWPGAGVGQARAPLLRAHPLLADGVVTGPAFGRRLLHATVEHQRPIMRLAEGAVGVAAFVDAARAWSQPGPGVRWHADAGLGIRVALPAGVGTLRVDVARGLRDRRHVVSAGWLAGWPGH